MSKSSFRYNILLLLLSLPFWVHAQDSTALLKSYDRLMIENPWLSSSNKAGNVFNSFTPDGEFELKTNLGRGDLKLTQLSPEERNYGFNAHKTISLKNIVFDGGVEYLNQQQENVGWTARMNPLTHNPYMLADSINGLYSKDYVSLFGSFGYCLNPSTIVGLNINYLVGDGARIKDPRPVNDLFSLEVSPSFIYVFPEFKLGANLHFLMGREKIGYTTIENSTTYRFFRFLGLGNGAKTVNGWSYARNYYSSGMGGEIQADYKIGKLKVFSGLGYFNSVEASEDDTYNPRKNDAGDYKESSINFFTTIIYKDELIHSSSFYVNSSFGKGIEFLQEPYLEDNITQYRTVAELDKYTFILINPGISYQLVKPYSAYFNKWKLDAVIELDHQTSNYLLEANQRISNIISSLSFDHTVFFGKNQLTYGINGLCVLNIGKELTQQRPYIAQQSIAAWDNIVYPDYLLLTSNLYSLGSHLKYGRSVNVLKTKQSLVYVDLNMNYRFAANEEWADNKTWEFYGIKLGITY